MRDFWYQNLSLSLLEYHAGKITIFNMKKKIKLKRFSFKEIFNMFCFQNIGIFPCRKKNVLRSKRSNFQFFFLIFRLLSIGVINGSLPTREVYQYHRWDFDRKIWRHFLTTNCKISSTLLLSKEENSEEFKKIIYQEFEQQKKIKKVPP